MGTIGTYTTVDNIRLTRLRKGEFATFINRLLALIEEVADSEDERPGGLSLRSAKGKGASAIGLSADFVDGMTADAAQLDEQIDESTASDRTPEAEQHERNRDALTSYITMRISQAASLPIAAEAEAGAFLERRVRPYQNITRLPVAEETAKIKGLLIDLRKPECTSHVTTLGLDTYVTELEKENKAYEAAVGQRTSARAQNTTESVEVLRKRLTEDVSIISFLAQSFAAAVPSEEASTFVNKLNRLIAETNAAYNRRIGQSSGGSTGTDDNTPDDPDGEDPAPGKPDGERPGEL